MHDAYEYNKNVRPTFPYESQWEEFKGLQRVRFWIWVISFVIVISTFLMLISRTLYNEVETEFAVGFVSGVVVFSVMGAILKFVVGRVGRRR
jgi:L-asparagine transporter-like permease